MLYMHTYIHTYIHGWMAIKLYLGAGTVANSRHSNVKKIADFIQSVIMNVCQ